MPWLIGASVLLVWFAWSVAPLLRPGNATNHSEFHGDSCTSIQELACANPPADLAALYLRRLRRFGGYLFLQTYISRESSSVWCFFVPLLRFGALRHDDGRETLTVGNGFVCRHGGTLAFVHKGGKMRIELRGFRSRFPRFLYRGVQLPIHAAIGRSFLSWAARRSK